MIANKFRWFVFQTFKNIINYFYDIIMINILQLILFHV